MLREKTATAAVKHSVGSPSVIAAQMSVSPGSTTIPYRVIGLSRDRTKFFGVYSATASRRNGIAQSTDGGVTWTNLRSMSATLSTADIVAMLELPSGEIIVALSPYGSFPARIYRSSGWQANPATATFALVLTMTGGSLLQQYSLNDHAVGSNGVLLAAESGPQTSAPTGITISNQGSGYTTATLATVSGGTGHDIRAFCLNGKIERVGVINGGSGHTDGTHSFTISGDGTGAAVSYTVTGGVINGAQTDKARRLFMSTDFGETWSQIFDIYTDPEYKYGHGLHLHAAAYDDEWDRIWLLTGDNTGDGLKISGYPTKTQVCYSDDRGASWQWLEAIPYLEPDGVPSQFTSIMIRNGNLVLGADAHYDSCFVVIPRTDYRQLGTPVFGAHARLDGQGIAKEFVSAHSPDKSTPVFATYINGKNGIENPIFLTSDGGNTWSECWRETDLATRPAISAGGPTAFYGPDTSNRIIANYNGYNNSIVGTLLTNF